MTAAICWRFRLVSYMLMNAVGIWGCAMGKHQFGGDWTHTKLGHLRKYLNAYTTLFKSNERARFLNPIYVDAFAGTGKRSARQKSDPSTPLLDQAFDQELLDYQKGSARIALEIEHAFDQYVFIEKNSERIADLEELRREFPSRNVTIEHNEANQFLRDWCGRLHRNDRAVVFLDPYGMDVEWDTLTCIAETKRIDLWYLFPLGMGVNRLLTREHEPPKAWSDRLDLLFGTHEWHAAFYEESNVLGCLFEDEASVRKTATYDRIGKFFMKRLGTIFPFVAKNPQVLENSRGPLYLFCFAAGNEKGGPTAVKIAESILGR